MARSKRGVHAPNSWSTRYDLDKFLLLADTISHVTMLDSEADLVPVLRQHGVDSTLLVRFYHGPWWGDFARATPLLDPTDWAEHVVFEYNRDRGGWTLASAGAHVVWDNELNLSEEGGGPGNDLDTGRGITWYQRINTWKLRVRQVVGNRIPADRIHWGAMAYGHSDDDNTRGYCGMEICRESVNAYAVLDVHPYWFEPAQVADPYHGHRFVLAHALFPTKPIFLSEAGNFAVTRASTPDEMAQWFASLDTFPYITGATPFIFRDPTGAHAKNNWGTNLAIERRIIAMAPVITPPPVTPPTPLTGKLWLAIVPSNQDRNPVLGGGNEQTQVAAFAAALVAECARYKPVTAKLFAGQPESQDATTYAGLRAQTAAAKAWLATAPAGTYTVALNLHTDSGSFSHIGYYYVGTNTVSQRIGRRAATAIAPFFGANTPVWSDDYSDYIFAEASQAAAAVLLELGSHQWASDVAVLKAQATPIARAIVEAVLTELGLATTRTVVAPGPVLNKAELGTLPRWATERLAAGQDFRGADGLAAFKEHLAAIHADPKQPARYGWPA